MAFYMKPGRGPMQKTGRGIPEGFKQVDDPTDPNKNDEKSGTALGEYNSSMSAPVPTKTGDAVTDSYVSHLYAQDVEDDKTRNAQKEKAYQKVKPVKWESYNIGGRGKKIKVEVSSIDEKTGDVSYQNIKTGKRNTASRSTWRDMATSGRSLKRFVDREKHIAASKK